MSQSTALKDIARSINLGFLADDVVEALEATEGHARTDQEQDVFLSAARFLEAAKRGFAIVEERQPISEGIASAVDNAQGFREAQLAFSTLPEPAPDRVQELLDGLIDAATRLADGQKVTGPPFSQLLVFFDALGRSTLSGTTAMLQERAHEKFENGLRPR